MMNIAVGEVLGGYHVTRFLGRGGFSYVYLAEEKTTGDKVALKFGNSAGGGQYITRLLEVTPKRTIHGISPDETPGEAVFFHSQGVRIDFLDKEEIDTLIVSESDLLSRIVSPHVVKIKKTFEVDGRPVIALEYIRGKTLREKIRNLEGIHLNWFLAAVRALQALNAEGTLPFHGDLKPENVLIKPSGRVVLIDPAYRNGTKDTLSTTPFYNPLVLRDSKADVMSIGIMIYEILTGTLPFEEVPWQYAGRDTRGDTIRLSLSYFMSYQPPRQLNPKTPDGLEDIIYRCVTVPSY
ncbi:MAG: serine/threonine protein kinase, partial [Planctomycetota bacterium]